jgi:fructokinase
MNSKKDRSCTGAGLLALDILLMDDDLHNPKLYAGGSMGNVQSILSFLGWDTFPIARLEDDYAADEIKKDLIRWGVNLNLVFTTDDGSTPVIIQRNYKDRYGNPKHRFQFRCPVRNEWFPSYKPIIRKSLEGITLSHQESNVFYFDRVSRANIDLAKYYKQLGALVFFEPSSTSGEKLFIESLGIADIIKFSEDRIKRYNTYRDFSNAYLEIITLGDRGLKYRFGIDNSWHEIGGFQNLKITDTSGAGDWFSASFIDFLGNDALDRLVNLKTNELIAQLKLSQAYSAINCQFEGARGAMYNLDKEILIQAVYELCETDRLPVLLSNHDSKAKMGYTEIVDLLYS